MVIGLFANSASVEILLNNLSEADFDPATVSVILKDPKLRNKIANDAGPLKGTAPAALKAKLVQLGLAAPDAQTYADAVAKGQALVLITPPPAAQAAAAEMFQDQSGIQVKTIH